MGSKNKPARIIQRATGWSYMRSLRFVRDRQTEADEFADVEGISSKDALLQMAIAEVESDG